MPGFAGTHLSPAHNVIHIVSGTLALYFGWKGSLSAARNFCFVFGAVYLGLGLAGFFLGAPGAPTLLHPGHAPDDRLWKVLPGSLELGTRDHILHVLVGGTFLVGGLFSASRSVAIFRKAA